MSNTLPAKSLNALNATPWHQVSPEQVVDELSTNPDEGLSLEAAKRRLEEFGPNEVEAAQMAPWWRILVKQFLDPLIFILFVAALIALVFADYIDAGVIFAVLIINGAIGFYQEMRARRAILSLAAMTAPRARVLRAGKEQDLPSRELVPGDLVLLESGARVPADLRLLTTRELTIDESALTGESLPVFKNPAVLEQENLVPGDQLNMAFSTTVVARGRATGVVVRTGEATELGQIASSMRDVVETRAPIQQKVRTLSHWIGGAIVVMAVVVGLVGWLQGRETAEIVSMIIAMAVAAIPEALPIVLTVTLAVGVQRMAKRNAITRSLPAVETLGSTTVICSDKTGTLTMNEMTVKAIWAGGRLFDVPGSGYEVSGQITRDGQPVDLESESALRKTLLAGLLANEARAVPTADDDSPGDPTEIALLVSAETGGLPLADTRSASPQLDAIPFESERKYMATLHDDGEGRRVVYLKGAPEAILDRCKEAAGPEGTMPLDREAAAEASRELAARGFRVLAMAYAPWTGDQLEEEDLAKSDQVVFAGFQAMEDPLRPETKGAVEQARSAGIRVLMLTGDHMQTARAIGRQLGLGGKEARVIEGRELHKLDGEPFEKALREIDIYARVAPEHKLRIVEGLKAQDEIVAVTGDGVNDAPALRAAHLGVAMGKGGTDVAREASDMVLSDDNFASIAAAVEEGRLVFNNIRKVTYFLLSTGVGLVLAIFLALFAGWPLPFVAVQVLWINLVTKGLQDVALAFEPGEPGLLNQAPRPTGEGVFNRPVLIRMVTIGIFLAVVTVGVFWWAMTITGGDLVLSQSIAMTQMVVFQFFHVGNCRSLHRSVLQIPLFSNRFLFVAVSSAMVAHIAILYLPPLQFLFQTAPLSLFHWAVIVAVATSIVVVAEVDKWWLRRRGYGPGLAHAG